MSAGHWLALAALVIGALTAPALSEASDVKIVIAHRGASGYLPEHTLASKAMAYAMGADFLEQDVVLTKDDRALVLHDIHIDTVTNVAEVFPRRERSDGRYYAIDFTWKELQRLTVTERSSAETGDPVYPRRFPKSQSRFSLNTLEEEIELIQGLNKSTGRSVGLYVEIKEPAWHQGEGHDITKVVMGLLDAYGYTGQAANAYVQCFDPSTLRRLRSEFKTELRLIQLIGENSWNEAPGADYDVMQTPAGLDDLATFVDGIGPWHPQVVSGVGDDGALQVTPLVRLAHKRGLAVHPYTFRADDLPEYAPDLDALLRIFLFQVGVDGVFTDFPDQAKRLVRSAGADTQ